MIIYRFDSSLRLNEQPEIISINYFYDFWFFFAQTPLGPGLRRQSVHTKLNPVTERGNFDQRGR